MATTLGNETIASQITGTHTAAGNIIPATGTTTPPRTGAATWRCPYRTVKTTGILATDTDMDRGEPTVTQPACRQPPRASHALRWLGPASPARVTAAYLAVPASAVAGPALDARPGTRRPVHVPDRRLLRARGVYRDAHEHAHHGQAMAQRALRCHALPRRVPPPRLAPDQADHGTRMAIEASRVRGHQGLHPPL